MNILYIGDIYAEPGLKVIEKILPGLRQSRNIDLVVAQAENVSNGRGITIQDYQQLKGYGVDFFTGGNWSLSQPEIFPYMNDPDVPIVRPANYPSGTPGLGYKYINTKAGDVLVVSLIGGVVGRDADKPTDNPLEVIDNILESESQIKKVATIVNLHGDYSSEKLVIGFYLDSRVSAVIGDHWHISTADAKVLKGGTAHITDVGMCGTINSSLGVKTEIIIDRWRYGKVVKNAVETEGPLQFNAVLINVDTKTGLSKSIDYIHQELN